MNKNFTCNYISKIGVLLMAIICLTIISSHNVYADSKSDKQVIKQMKEKRISVNQRGKLLDDLLGEICKKAELSYVFDSSIKVSTVDRYSLNVSNVSIESAITKLLQDTPYTYQIVDGKIVVRNKTIEPQVQEAKRALTIRGKVLDTAKKPIIGALVLLEGTGYGALTDDEGMYMLVLDANKSDIAKVLANATLEASFTGKESIKIPIYVNGVLQERTYNNLIITLKDDIMDMNSVVVTGYGNISKTSFTGSYTTVTQEELKRISPNNVLSALQVIDPSFRVMLNNEFGSDPNAVPDISIRGNSGIGVTELDEGVSRSEISSNPNLPTFIIDGFEVSVTRVFDLNVNRIASISILKDAAATAMYGSRAANGVVVITTIPPKPGELQVSYRTNFTVSAPDLSKYNLANGEEKLAIEKAAGIYDWRMQELASTVKEPTYSYKYEEAYNQKLRELERGVYTDWASLPLRNTISQTHFMRLEGGAEGILYGLDLDFKQDNGVMKESFRRNYGLGFDVQYTSAKFLFKNSVAFNATDAEDSPYGSYSNFTLMNPYDAYTDEFGNVLEYIEQNFGGSSSMGSAGSGGEVANPMYDATLGSFGLQDIKEFRDNLSIKYFINANMNVQATLGYSLTVNESSDFIDPMSGRYLNMSTDKKGSLTNRTDITNSLDARLGLYYNKVLGNHNINAGFNIEARESQYSSTVESYTGFPQGGFTDPIFAEEMINDRPTKVKDKARSFGSNIYMNYTYKDIYLLDLSGRIEGSSVFGTESKVAPFWSAGAGLNIHNYNFMKNQKVFTRLKLAASYGQTGKADFAPSTARTTYELLSLRYPTGSAAGMVALGNENLKWEITNKLNLLLDVEMFSGALQVKFERYFNTTNDLIADVAIPASTGFLTYKDNIGAMTNNGYDIFVRALVYNSNDLRIFVNGNLNHNVNEITEISNSLQRYNERVDEIYAGYTDQRTKPLLKYYPGASTTAIYALQSVGIDPMTGQEYYRYRDGSTGFEYLAAEQTVVGDTEPTAIGTFGVNAYYRGFTFSAYFSYEFGGDFYNQTLQSKIENANLFGNVDKRILTERWMEPGQNASFKAIQDYKSITLPTSRFVQENNVLRGTSISLGYDIPKRIVDKLSIGRANVSLSTNELFYLSTIQQERGTSYPFARDFNISLEITF